MQLLVLILVLLVAVPAQSFACSPVPNYVPPTIEQSVDRLMLSNAIKFVAKVELIDSKPVENSDNTEYRLRVLKQYKGEPLQEITVMAHSTSCGKYRLEAGETDIISPMQSGDGWSIAASPYGKYEDQAGLEKALDEYKEKAATK